MKYTFSLTAAFLSALVLACTESIEIDPGAGFSRLLVEGSITTDTMAHTLMLSSTAGYFSNQPLPKVSGAKVAISDGDVTYTLRENSPGIYQTDPGVFGLPGHTYLLDIKLPSSVGGYSDYTATSTISQPAVLDSIQVKFNPDWSEKGIWEVKGFFLDSPTADFYRFMIYRNGVMITDTLSDWFVTDDQFFNGRYLLGASIAYLQQHRQSEYLQTGDRVTAEMNVIEKAYAEFIRSAQSGIRGSYPLFSGPPANVKGNISHGAIGFFAAFSVSRKSVAVP